MRRIDGSDGGGQVLRTALSLAVVTDTPVRVDDVRGARPTPGLQPQHLATVDLVADHCDADVEGATIGSESVTFRPGATRESSLSVDVRTAGSVTLLFDPLLPIGTRAEEPLEVTATGGTDVKWSPTVGYLRRVKLPLLSRFGLRARVDLERTGFYPAGGGRATLRIEPASLSPVRLDRRGALERVEVYSKASASLSDAEVADRQATQAVERLDEAGFPAVVASVDHVESHSPGSSLLLRGVYEETVLGVDSLGERGTPSEAVADDAVDRFEAVHAGSGAVDPHMADQVLVFLALAGGRVRIHRVTDHVRTNLAVLEAFGSDVSLEGTSDGEPSVEESDDGVTLVATPLHDGA